MNYKKVLPLTAALILGLISARMVVQIMHGKAAVINNGPKLVSVVTAGRDVTAGEQLGSDALTTNQIVADNAPGATFSDPSELLGRVVTAPLVKGQAIVESLLAPRGTAGGLQAVIPSGMRAVTIDVNEVSGVAGYITAGCRVDLIQTVHDDANNQLIGRCIAQNVQVTAVGTRGATLDAGPAHSVTLLMTPRQAQLIELAAANGHPRLALRGTQDNQTDETSPVTLADLTGGIRDIAPAPVKSIAGDPFAATTQPTARSSDDWHIRVVAAGESKTVSVRSTQIPGQSAVTGNDVRPVTGQ